MTTGIFVLRLNYPKMWNFFRSFQNHLFYSFLGIPYAKPPVGPARFNYSEPIEPWNGVFDADRHMPCLQFEQATSYIRGVEDCLVVSIYTPKLPSVEDPLLIPVFVWLHGNDFHRGSGNADLQGPNRIMDYDVIMVTMNFRLGPLGFMTLEDDTLPGNLGLWDQKLALEWIQLNIASFGGDPEKITIGKVKHLRKYFMIFSPGFFLIAGSGAGGTSVLLHYISPHSCGLFRSAIALSPTSFPSTNVSHYTKALVSKLGCDSPEKILECLSTKTSEAFVRKAYMFTSPNMNWAPMPFTAIIDDFATKPFVPLHPLEAIKKGLFNDVPLIIGHNRDEGASILTQLTHNMTIFDHFLKHWNKIAPVMLFNKLEQDLENEHFEVVKILNQRYFGQENGPKSRGNFLANFGQFYTDAKVGFHVHYIANEVFKKSESPIFQYLYSHAGSLSLAEVVHLDFWQVLWKVRHSVSKVHFVFSSNSKLDKIRMGLNV